MKSIIDFKYVEVATIEAWRKAKLSLLDLPKLDTALVHYADGSLNRGQIGENIKDMKLKSSNPGQNGRTKPIEEPVYSDERFNYASQDCAKVVAANEGAQVFLHPLSPFLY